MKVLIATQIFQRIKAKILLQIGYGGYRVTTREAETVSQMIQQPLQSLHGINMEDKDSNYEVPGFLDIEDMDEHISNHRQMQEEGEGSPKYVANSNSNSNDGGDKGINDCGQH